MTDPPQLIDAYIDGTLDDAERLHLPLIALMSLRLEHIRRIGE